MTDEQFLREIRYGVVAHVVGLMLRSGIVTKPEYRKICKLFYAKYAPIIGGA